jgi:hypothetical protein
LLDQSLEHVPVRPQQRRRFGSTISYQRRDRGLRGDRDFWKRVGFDKIVIGTE